MILRITAPHFVAGLVFENGRAKDVAPIVGFMRGWTLERVMAYCIKKDWTYKEGNEHAEK